MTNLRKAINNLSKNLAEEDRKPPIPFEEYVKNLAADPNKVLRNVFQVFHDMVNDHVGQGEDEYPDDPESIQYSNLYFFPKMFTSAVANSAIELLESVSLYLVSLNGYSSLSK